MNLQTIKTCNRTITPRSECLYLNMTLAWSLLFIPLTGKIPSMTAVCRMLPMWTVVRKPATISVGWNSTHTLACSYYFVVKYWPLIGRG